jgi:6-phosphogluconate dehydrogenase
MPLHQVGVVGLAVMGRNLALNIAEHGYSVAVYNRTAAKVEELLAIAGEKRIVGTNSLADFVQALEQPRKIILMVKAGEAVDDMLQRLLPHLASGDLVVDGGNSHYLDTVRRHRELKDKGIHFVGAGISGGEEGALKGPAIMPGGDKKAYSLVESVLTAIAAKVEGKPCCTYIGGDGAGHFVKMVHNGIEYADMQLICEAYFLLKKMVGLTAPQIHEIFKKWNQGELSSYLIEITADIFTKIDAETGQHLVDVILDVAGEKGTGKWTSHSGLDFGVAIPTITEAVFARYLSAAKAERIVAGDKLQGPRSKEKPSGEDSGIIESIRRALYASKICAYAQGFSLLAAASREYDWRLNLGEISMIFRGGCIIRAQFLARIKETYEQKCGLNNLLLAEYFSDILERYQQDWREVIAAAVVRGIPIPAFSSALAYFDGYRSRELPANLLQAQRDYFGAHQYQRVDKNGYFHTQW